MGPVDYGAVLALIVGTGLVLTCGLCLYAMGRFDRKKRGDE